MNQTFPKHERLHGRNAFQKLFSEGKVFYCYPFKCVYLWGEGENFSAKMAVSVSKKKFKRAVDRNRIKRLIKESYRLEKAILFQNYENIPKNLDLIIIYTETKIHSFSFINKKVIELINKIIKTNETKNLPLFEENFEKTENNQ